MSMREITPLEAKALMENESYLLIDVREPVEHETLHIPSSRLLPLGKISADDISDHSQTLLVYCQKGMRSKKACQKLLEHNPSLKVCNIVGGIENWQQSGFETQTGNSKLLPLDRQVQITMGMLIMLFSALSLSVSAIYSWGTAFIGLGLFISGATGFCGLARVIAKMPWNQRV